MMNPNHISLCASLNYYVDTSKFILVSLSRVRGPFQHFLLDKMQNWNGPHGVFQVHYTCVHIHVTFRVGSVAVGMSGMVHLPCVLPLSPGRQPWLSCEEIMSSVPAKGE